MYINPNSLSMENVDVGKARFSSTLLLAVLCTTNKSLFTISCTR